MLIWIEGKRIDFKSRHCGSPVVVAASSWVLGGSYIVFGIVIFAVICAISAC